MASKIVADGHRIELYKDNEHGDEFLKNIIDDPVFLERTISETIRELAGILIIEEHDPEFCIENNFYSMHFKKGLYLLGLEDKDFSEQLDDAFLASYRYCLSKGLFKK